MTLPPEIFKAYDIRGVVGKTLTTEIVRAIGQTLGTLALEAGRDALVVGRDGRLSGPELAAAVADGIRAAGANVIVTDNRRHFLAALRHGIRVETPPEFLRTIKMRRG